MYNDDEITLEQVRLAMPHIAKDRNKSMSEVTINEVRNHFKRGNNGTLGALKNQVIFEHILAARYDREDISTQLKAAFTSEIERFVKNANDRSEEIISVLKNDHAELCELNSNLTIDINRLNKALEAAKAEASAKEREFAAELAAEKVRSEHLAGEHNKLTADLERLRQEISEAKQDQQNKSKQIGELTSSFKSAESDRNALKESFQAEQQAKEEAKKNAALAQQEANMLQMTISRLESQNQRLESQVKKHEDKITEIEEQRAILHERLYEAMGEEQQKRSNKRSSKSNKATTQP